jgi:hypothetical protein
MELTRSHFAKFGGTRPDLETVQINSQQEKNRELQEQTEARSA